MKPAVVSTMTYQAAQDFVAACRVRGAIPIKFRLDLDPYVDSYRVRATAYVRDREEDLPIDVHVARSFPGPLTEKELDSFCFRLGLELYEHELREQYYVRDERTRDPHRTVVAKPDASLPVEYGTCSMVDGKQKIIEVRSAEGRSEWKRTLSYIGEPPPVFAQVEFQGDRILAWNV